LERYGYINFGVFTRLSGYFKLKIFSIQFFFS